MAERRTPSLSTLRNLGRGLLVLLLLGGAGAWWAWHGAFGMDALQDVLRHHPAAPVLFLLLHILASLLFFPRSVMAMVAGLVFGVWWGGVLAAAGSVIGASTGFLLTRYVCDGLVPALDGARWGDALRRLETGGWRAVAMLRLVPVLPHSGVNYALGLTRVRLGAYAFGSLVGQLPMTVAFVQFGAAGDHALAGKPDWIAPTVIGLSLLILSVLLPKVGPKLREKFGAGRA
ncbi:TVP38/TMEM64 family protein [Azospirillum brasilense]|uniref:TVP38/TMEM64 family membrane protein n=1 Tax=Azospirillum brasilense TaxID=192 RepID=A0A6L3ASS2_AZOBR|nr:VTT domain-containing protein [Azospirillum brasilense]KAA0677895.1 DedA family protein [Azospirillum brasilense]